MVSSAVDAVAVLKCLPQKRLANPRFGVVMAAIAAVVPCGIYTAKKYTFTQNSHECNDYSIC